jgi:hypothetical protein
LVVPRFEKLRDFSMTTPGYVFSVALTFNFIALGWVWFALPTTTESIRVFRLLAGF